MGWISVLTCPHVKAGRIASDMELCPYATQLPAGHGVACDAMGS